MSLRPLAPLLLTLAMFGLALRSAALVDLALGLAAILGAAGAWGRRSLSGVRRSRRVEPERAFPGDSLALTLTWENRKWLPLAWLESDEDVPAGFAFPPGFLRGHHLPGRDRLVNLLPLLWYERVSRRFTLVAVQRGRYVFGPGRLRSGDLFGLTDAVREEPDTCDLLVYPRVLPPDALGLPALRPLGDRRWGPPFFEDPTRLAGVREYQIGDGLGRVHWKATAHTGRLQVKVYESSASLSLGLFLNCSTFPHAWQGVDRPALERAVEVAASLAVDALNSGYQVGLYANGLLPGRNSGVHLPPASGSGQLQQVLEALALVEPFGSERLPDLLVWEGRRLPWGAAVVLVTAPLDDDVVLGLQELQRSGHPVALVLVGRTGGGGGEGDQTQGTLPFPVHQVEVADSGR